MLTTIARPFTPRIGGRVTSGRPDTGDVNDSQPLAVQGGPGVE